MAADFPSLKLHISHFQSCTETEKKEVLSKEKLSYEFECGGEDEVHE
jgi:hypothetical protein